MPSPVRVAIAHLANTFLHFAVPPLTMHAAVPRTMRPHAHFKQRKASPRAQGHDSHTAHCGSEQLRACYHQPRFLRTIFPHVCAQHLHSFGIQKAHDQRHERFVTKNRWVRSLTVERQRPPNLH